MKILGRGFRMGELGLNKVTFLLFVFGSFLFFYESRGKEPESLISVFEQRRSLLLEHCSRRKTSEEASMRKISNSESPEPSIKDLHFVRDLPGDLVFCLVKKAGSTSLNTFFLNTLEPADEVAWLHQPDVETQMRIVRSRTSLRVMVMRHPFTRTMAPFIDPESFPQKLNFMFLAKKVRNEELGEVLKNGIFTVG